MSNLGIGRAIPHDLLSTRRVSQYSLACGRDAKRRRWPLYANAVLVRLGADKVILDTWLIVEYSEYREELAAGGNEENG